MEIFAGLSIGILVYLAFVFDVAGFMARDELWWRLLMLTASGFYLIYYYFVTDMPLWDALITNGILAGVNLVMVGVVISERSTIGMAQHTINIFRQFPLLSPGQFRRLMRASEHLIASETTTLVTQDSQPTHLYYVLEGDVEIIKDGHATKIDPCVFVAEIAYLTGAPASATVRVHENAVYLQWETSLLKRSLKRSPALQAALIANLNLDLAHKVANSLPRMVAGPG